MTSTVNTQTTVEPITNLEKWAIAYGAERLTVAGDLCVALDAEAVPLSFILNEARTAVSVSRADDSGKVTVAQQNVSAHTLVTPRLLGTVMAELAGDVIASAVHLRSSPNGPNPNDLDLVELSEHERYALPAGYHWPIWYDIATPAAWMCTVCWGDGIAHGWPCAVAARHGRDIATAAGLRYTV